MAQSTKKKKRKPVDMDKLRQECQRWHSTVMGLLKKLNIEIWAVYSEMKSDPDSPLHEIWESCHVYDVADKVGEAECNGQCLFIANYLPFDDNFPAPLALLEGAA